MDKDLTIKNIYCSFCGRKINICRCKVKSEVETKVIEVEESKKY